jgi:hypothetical protein
LPGKRKELTATGISFYLVLRQAADHGRRRAEELTIRARWATAALDRYWASKRTLSRFASKASCLAPGWNGHVLVMPNPKDESGQAMCSAGAALSPTLLRLPSHTFLLGSSPSDRCCCWSTGPVHLFPLSGCNHSAAFFDSIKPLSRSTQPHCHRHSVGLTSLTLAHSQCGAMARDA